MSENYFGNRLQPFDNVGPAGGSFKVLPPAADDMLRADEQVAENVAELNEALAAPSEDELATLGKRVARGELKPETARQRLSYAGRVVPSVFRGRGGAGDLPAGVLTSAGRSYASTVVAAAQAEWRKQLDREEWKLTALKTSTLPVLKDTVEAGLSEAVDSWHALPESVQDEWRNRRSHDLRTVARNLSIDTIPGVELEARRRAAVAWNWFDGVPLTEWVEFLTGGKFKETSYPVNFDDILLLSGEPLKFAAAGYTISDLVVLDLLDDFDVIVDPFGADADEFAERRQAYIRIREWLFEANVRVAANVPVSVRQARVMNERQRMPMNRRVAKLKDAEKW